MSFQTQVEDRVGTISDTSALTDWLTDGARIVIDYLANRRSDKLDLYATEKSDSGSGVDITGGRPISAHKSNYPARRIPVEMKARAVDADSSEYATATDPVWYVSETKGYVLPLGGTIRWAAYPAVAYNASTVSNFPPEGYPAFVLYASIQYQIRNINDLIKSTLGGLTFTFPSTVTPPAAPSFTYTDAIADTIGTETIVFTDTLTFVAPTFGGDYTDMDTALSNQDVDLASGFGLKLKTQLEEFNEKLQNAVAEFNKDSQSHQLNLQKAIEQARINSQRLAEQAKLTTDVDLQNKINSLKKEMDEYSASLGKYQSDNQSYSIQVNKEIQRVGTLVQQYQTMSANYIEILKELRQEYKTIMETL